MPFNSSNRGRRGDAGGARGRGQHRGQGGRRPLSRSASNRQTITYNLHDGATAGYSTSRRGQDGPMGPRSSSYRGSGSRVRFNHRSRSAYSRRQNPNPPPNQRYTRPQRPHSSGYRSQYRPARRHRNDSLDNIRREERSETHVYSSNPNGRYQSSRNQEQNGHFRSTNPDFRLLVRSTNNGARLLNHMGNWERLPGPIEKAVDDLAGSIRPPLMDEDFKAQMDNIGEKFKTSVHRVVNQHLIKKYVETCRSLAILDDTDMDRARQIARKQLVRSNHRLNNNRADNLLSLVLKDTRDHYFSEMTHRAYNPAAGQQTAPPQTHWQQPRHPAATQLTSPPQDSAPTHTSNRFQPLADLGDDELEANALIQLLDETMEEPDTRPATTSTKRLVSRRSPNGNSPPTKTRVVVDRDDGFTRPLTTVPKTRGHPTMRPSSLPGTTQLSTPHTAGPEVGLSDPPGGSGESQRESDIEPSGSPLTTPDGNTMRERAALMECPAPPVPGPQRQRQTSEPARRSVTNTANVAAGLRTVPSSPVFEAPPAVTRYRLSLFNANLRRTWTWPSFRPEEDTVVLTDSNGVGIAQHTPNTWRVAAFRGALVEDATKILSDSPLPTSVKRIVIFMGINNRDRQDPLMVSHLSRLRDVIAIQTRQVTVVPLPPFVDEAPATQTTRIRFNGALQDLLGDSGKLIHWPLDYEARQLRDGDGFRHLSAQDCETFAMMVSNPDCALNPTPHPQ